MSIPKPPEKPKFISDITWVQKLVAGVSGSMFLMALVTMIPWIESMFKPDYLFFLSTLRAGMAGCSFLCGAFVGIPQIKGMIDWIIDFYEYYNKFKDIKKDKE